MPAPDGTRVRVRVVNTDNAATSVWTGRSPYRVLAVDGVDLIGPTPVADRTVPQPGQRVDLLSYGTPAALGFDPGPRRDSSRT